MTIFVVRLVPSRDHPTSYAAVRRVLKYALRVCGLRCVGITQELTMADDTGKIDPAAAKESIGASGRAQTDPETFSKGPARGAADRTQETNHHG